ncbi:MAG TPA: hypothetical protein VFN25_01995 [Dokdonella sp.]|uniref:hypothetical protein n=1 Tax=Dokdonella sp. TaxID=2291710 RepID=UPI002D7F2B78|nr:hypothetical protein [Dokdonella sp.]HET9031656.1 hypothetical protein [Dokdonella sp.]
MRPILAICIFLLLSACAGSGPGKAAADACVAEANQRLQGKTFDLDAAKLAASAAQEAGTTDIWHLSTPVVFDRGLASEFTQNFKCKARVDAGKANVISLEFIWAMEDLKLDESGAN